MTEHKYKQGDVFKVGDSIWKVNECIPCTRKEIVEYTIVPLETTISYNKVVIEQALDRANKVKRYEVIRDIKS